MAFLLNWLYSALEQIGMKNKEANVIFLGLDNAGKSTLLHLLKTGQITSTAPTLYPTAEEFTLGGLTIRAHDLGGHNQARPVWKTYFANADAIVFIVDAADRERLPEVREELHRLLCDDDVAELPVAILANKIDAVGALQESDFKDALMLKDSCTGKGATRRDTSTRPLEVFMCSFKGKTGYGAGFRWLANYV